MQERRRLPAVIRAGDKRAEISDEFREQELPPGVERPSEREMRDALREIPEDLNWAWARPRLTPLFERPDAEGISGDPFLHAVTPLGVAVCFGIEIGPLFAGVTRSMAERWEASLEQIEAAAFEHLRLAVDAVAPAVVQQGVHRGHLVRVLPEPVGWASSAILAGEATVARLFGPHDQVFTVPSRHMLVSFDAAVPRETVVDLTLGLEELDQHPLQLDAFVLQDGRLSWLGLVEAEAQEG